MHLLSALTLIAILLVSSGPATVATPVVPSPGDFVTPDPTECRIEQRTIESVVAVVATPAAETPAINTPTVGTPTAEPADGEMVRSVTATARESVACFNAGDFLRQLALYTDNGLRSITAGEGLTAEEVIAFLGGTPVPMPVAAWESVRVRDVRSLPDGRVTAFFDVRNPDGTFTSFVTLVRRDDRYLVDSDVEAAMEPATPAP